jgi:hypothetical protein
LDVAFRGVDRLAAQRKQNYQAFPKAVTVVHNGTVAREFSGYLGRFEAKVSKSRQRPPRKESNEGQMQFLQAPKRKKGLFLDSVSLSESLSVYPARGGLCRHNSRMTLLLCIILGIFGFPTFRHIKSRETPMCVKSFLDA